MHIAHTYLIVMLPSLSVELYIIEYYSLDISTTRAILRLSEHIIIFIKTLNTTLEELIDIINLYTNK